MKNLKKILLISTIFLIVCFSFCNLAVSELYIDSVKDSSTSTALSVGTVGVSTVGITSDGGADDVTLPAATNATAGVATAAQITALEAIDTEAELEALLEHDDFSDYVANEHIDWTQDQGATDIHAGNYTASSTALDDIGDPDAATTIGLDDGETIQINSAEDAGTVLTLNMTDNDAGGDLYGLEIIHAGDANSVYKFLKCTDNSTDVQLEILSNGNIDTEGTVNAGSWIMSEYGLITSQKLTDTAASGPVFEFERRRDGSPTSDVSSGDYLGIIDFRGYHTSGDSLGAIIRGVVDNTPGEDDMPTRLEFLVSPDGSETPVLAMEIDEVGNIDFQDGTIDLGRAIVMEYQNDTATVAPYIQMKRAKLAGADIVDNDELGAIRFYGMSNGAYQYGAVIAGVVDGTPGGDATDMPTGLEFLTSPDDSSTPVLALEIGSDGNMDFQDGNLTTSGLIINTVQVIPVTTEADLTITGSIVVLNGDDDTDHDTVDLQNGVSGQMLRISAGTNVDADDTIIMNYGDTTCTNCPAVTMDKTGEGAVYYFNGTTWICESINVGL